MKRRLGGGQRWNTDKGMVISRDFRSCFDSLSISVGLPSKRLERKKKKRLGGRERSTVCF